MPKYSSVFLYSERRTRKKGREMEKMLINKNMPLQLSWLSQSWFLSQPKKPMPTISARPAALFSSSFHACGKGGLV
jgi:hypothetical protein